MTNEEAEKILREFSEKLIRSQHSLPSDFENFLNENMWDLYA